MKTYTVNITDEVDASIRRSFSYISERSPQNAINWLRGLYQAIDTLETMPERCPLIREHEVFEAVPTRQRRKARARRPTASSRRELGSGTAATRASGSSPYTSPERRTIF